MDIIGASIKVKVLFDEDALISNENIKKKLETLEDAIVDLVKCYGCEFVGGEGRYLRNDNQRIVEDK